jgi:hypothetical protein
MSWVLGKYNFFSRNDQCEEIWMCIFSLADRIERTCDRFLAIFGINSPKLTTDQWGLKSVHITQLMVRKI